MRIETVVILLAVLAASLGAYAIQSTNGLHYRAIGLCENRGGVVNLDYNDVVCVLPNQENSKAQLKIMNSHEHISFAAPTVIWSGSTGMVPVVR